MKNALLSALVVLSGCGPLAVDFTIGWGANQSIKKTLEMDQKQTKAQTEAQVDVIEAVIDAVWKAQPTPTPVPPPKISSVTISMDPEPARISIEDRVERVRVIPKLLPAKPKSVKKSEDVCRCELGSGNLCTYHNDHVTCEPTK